VPDTLPEFGVGIVMVNGLSVLVEWLLDFAPLIVNLVQKRHAESLSRSKLLQSGDLREFLQDVGGVIQKRNGESNFDQEKLLQQQLALYSRETQLKLAAYQRETALKLPETHKILENWPLKLYPSQILESHSPQGPLPLRIFLAPPQTGGDRLHPGIQGIEIERRLSQGLREFLSTHYSLHCPTRPTEFLAGAWEGQRFHSEASIKALFGLLKSEPTLILESEMDGDFLNFRVAYWGLGQENYYYKTIAKFPYRVLLEESAKAQALAWQEIRDRLISLGEPLDAVNQMGGNQVANLELLEKEERWRGQGINVSQLKLNYAVSQENLDQVCQFLIHCHCLVAGWIADIYHLVYRDVPPLLPSLLPDLTQSGTDLPLVQAIAMGYQQVYQALENERRYWVPELALQLALSLTHLSEKSWAQEQVNFSLTTWLQLRQVSCSPEELAWDALQSVTTVGDRDYLETLKDCFVKLGDEQKTAQLEDLLASLVPTGSADRGGDDSPSFLQGIVSSIHALTGHPGKISSLAISPDGQRLVSGCLDKTIKVWNLLTGELIRTFKGHSVDVSSVAISPNGQFLASSSAHCSKSNVKVWNFQTGELLHDRLGHKKSARCVVFDTNRKIFFSSGNKIKIWDLSMGDRLCTLCHSSSVHSVAVSPDGQRLATGSSDGKIKLWHPQTGDPLRTLKGHESVVNALTISADGQILISASSDKTIKIWHLHTGQLIHTLKFHTASVNAIVMSFNGQWVISGSSDTTIKIWRLDTGELLHTLKEHTGPVNAIAISPDSQFLASGSSDKTIKIWRL
jgi:WD40 repeat protein